MTTLAMGAGMLPIALKIGAISFGSGPAAPIIGSALARKVDRQLA